MNLNNRKKSTYTHHLCLFLLWRKALPLRVEFPFTLGNGDLGLRASIRSVQPVVMLDDVKYLEYTSALKLLFVISGPRVSHPGLMVLSRPNTWSLE